jgi:hypothetical protein
MYLDLNYLKMNSYNLSFKNYSLSSLSRVISMNMYLIIYTGIDQRIKSDINMIMKIVFKGMNLYI